MSFRCSGMSKAQYSMVKSPRGGFAATVYCIIVDNFSNATKYHYFCNFQLHLTIGLAKDNACY